MKRRRLCLATLLAVLAALAAGCAESADPVPPGDGAQGAQPAPTLGEPLLPSSSPPPAETGGETKAMDAYGERAAMVLAAELGLTLQAVSVQSVEPVDWPDAGLGCPLPGMAYAQVITPGYLIKLAAADAEYAVHMDVAGTAIVCLPDGSPLPGSIPILPGERILDGKPWMPVD